MRSHLRWKGDRNNVFLFSVGDPQECPVLPNPSNGRIKSSRGRRVGASVWYACNSGYTLIGSESRTCLRNLSWSLQAPSCKRTWNGRERKIISVGGPQECQCPFLPNPSNGHIKYREARHVRASVWCACDSGYTLIGSESRTCLRNLSWSLQAPSCKRTWNLCRRPSPNPSNGHIKYREARHVRASIWCACDSGYTLIGSESCTYLRNLSCPAANAGN